MTLSNKDLADVIAITIWRVACRPAAPVFTSQCESWEDEKKEMLRDIMDAMESFTATIAPVKNGMPDVQSEPDVSFSAGPSYQAPVAVAAPSADAGEASKPKRATASAPRSGKRAPNLNLEGWLNLMLEYINNNPGKQLTSKCTIVDKDGYERNIGTKRTSIRTKYKKNEFSTEEIQMLLRFERASGVPLVSDVSQSSPIDIEASQPLTTVDPTELFPRWD